MKKLCYLGMLLFAACSSSGNLATPSNAQAAAPARDPACAECPADCCQGDQAAAGKVTAEKPASCCQDQAGTAKKN